MSVIFENADSHPQTTSMIRSSNRFRTPTTPFHTILQRYYTPSKACFLPQSARATYLVDFGYKKASFPNAQSSMNKKRKMYPIPLHDVWIHLPSHPTRNSVVSLNPVCHTSWDGN